MKLFPAFCSSFGLRAAFAAFAAVSAANFVFCAFLLPETAGKTLAEVEGMFEEEDHEEEEENGARLLENGAGVVKRIKEQ